LLEQANLILEILRFQVRLAKDLQCLKVESYGFAANDVRGQIAAVLFPLRLRLHPKKNVISPVKDGIRFLGYRVFPTHRLLPKENVRRVRQMQREYATGLATIADISQRLVSWIGHARQADTFDRYRVSPQFDADSSSVYAASE
jgi:hypothetical protein